MVCYSAWNGYNGLYCFRLSFMLENLSKPVILTGSQLPIGTLRTDGKENLITAIEIAAARIQTVQLLSPKYVFSLKIT